MDISLTWQEQLFAAQAGVMRRISALNNGRHEPYGTPKSDLWGNDIESAGAEAAVGKALNIFWQHGKLREYKGDVGAVEVRSTKLPNGRLILHDRDSDDAAFVLVRGKFPSYELVGWCIAREGKRPEYKFHGDGRCEDVEKQSYFVPNNILRPINEISRELF